MRNKFLAFCSLVSMTLYAPYSTVDPLEAISINHKTGTVRVTTKDKLRWKMTDDGNVMLRHNNCDDTYYGFAQNGGFVKRFYNGRDCIDTSINWYNREDFFYRLQFAQQVHDVARAINQERAPKWR